MEQQQRGLIFTAAVGLIILAIIVGSIYYLVKFIQGRVASNKQVPQASVSQIAEDFAVASNSGQVITQAGSPRPSGASQAQPPQSAVVPQSDKKSYNAGDFQISFAKNWGLVKCNNSKNIELDPTNPQDQSIACDVATKPITMVVSDIHGCEGQTVKIGNIEVVKSQASEGGYTKYQWCTKTSPVLNITHRVSNGGERATSKDDFSRQVEEIISTLSFVRGS